MAAFSPPLLYKSLPFLHYGRIIPGSRKVSGLVDSLPKRCTASDRINCLKIGAVTVAATVTNIAMKSFTLTVAVSIALLLSGCIVRDEVTTLAIRPDGSASLVIFHSNIRSTDEGAKADQELRQYVEDFDARKSADFTRISQAGGDVVDVRWVQREAPRSSLISATLPTVTALEKFCSIEGKDNGFRVATRYSENGSRRKLTMLAQMPEDFELPNDSARRQNKSQQDRANGFSETRIIVIGGRIVASQGWTVATDKRSALLSLEEITRLLQSSPDQIELFIEWEE